jgi:anti-sigma-K factor RskA
MAFEPCASRLPSEVSVPYDVNHALEHPDVAGWVLGVLDPVDAQAFEAHLGSCEACQATVAEFEPVARSLRIAAPAAEPPADLQARTVAAVQYAIMAAGRPEQAQGKASRWWHLHWGNRFMPLFTAAVAAAVTAAAFIGVQIFAFTAPAVAASYVLTPSHGQLGSATATARDVAGGYEIQLTAKDLPKLGRGEFYECWYAGPDSRPGHLDLIAGGTFSGNGTFTMWTAADLGSFRVMEITEEKAGAGSQQGQVVLRGTAQNVHDDDD